jgi:hypothetical protein
MALLGTLIDKVRGTLASVTVGLNTGYQTLAHALGQTPDFVVPIPVSIGNATVSPNLLALGGNAAVATIALANSTINVNAAPTVAYDAICFKSHSMIA